MGLDPREVDGRTLRIFKGTRQRVLPPLPLTSRPVSGHLQAGLEDVLDLNDLRVARDRPRALLRGVIPPVQLGHKGPDLVVEGLGHPTRRRGTEMARKECYLRLRESVIFVSTSAHTYALLTKGRCYTA